MSKKNKFKNVIINCLVDNTMINSITKQSKKNKENIT